MITEYVYDDLYRLDVMTHYEPDATPLDLSDNDKIAEYDYTVRADGRRTAVTETVWESGSPLETTIDWTYDNLGRLVEEVYDSHDDNLDFTATYSFDLVGNRIEKTVDQGSDSSIDETITYTYDSGDRLLTEVKDLASGTDTTTTYEYGGSTNPGTEQTKKTVTETATSALIQTVESTYNLQGRLSEVVIETYDSGDVVKRETTTYEYNESGIRVASTNKVEIDDDQDPQTALVVESETETTYLNDPQNPTGYSQVIEEITRDTATQDVTKDLVFTLGHDVIAQTEIDPAQAGSEAGDPLFLLYDGHGSTRFLAALDAAIQEGYSYDAYGNPIGFDPATALTALLYSGDPFDTRINQQYLRARWYDLSTGRFNRVDPFFGNLRDPQSLHKYLYVHADPITLVDPTGKEGLVAHLASIGIVSTLASFSIGAVFGAGVFGSLSEDDFIWDDAAEGALVGGFIGIALRVAAARKNLGETIANGIVSGLADLGTTYFLNGLLGDPQPTWQQSTKQFLRAFQAGAVGTALYSIYDKDEWQGVFKSTGASTSIQMLQRTAGYLIDPPSDASLQGYLESVIVSGIASVIIGSILSTKLSFGFGADLENTLGKWSAASQSLKAIRRKFATSSPAQQNALKAELQRLISGNAYARNSALLDIGAKLVDKFLVGIHAGAISTLPHSLSRWVDVISTATQPVR